MITLEYWRWFPVLLTPTTIKSSPRRNVIYFFFGREEKAMQGRIFKKIRILIGYNGQISLQFQGRCQQIETTFLIAWVEWVNQSTYGNYRWKCTTRRMCTVSTNEGKITATCLRLVIGILGWITGTIWFEVGLL